MRVALIYMKVFFDSLDGEVETLINIVPLESRKATGDGGGGPQGHSSSWFALQDCEGWQIKHRLILTWRDFGAMI